MPDVKLPDGRIVKNVPAGTTKEQLLARVGEQAAGADRLRGGLRAFAKGTSLGFLPEIDSAIRAGIVDPVFNAFNPEFDDDSTFGERFQQNRDVFNAEQAQFSQQNPGLNTALEISGGVTSGIASAPLMATTSLPRIAATGAAEGAIAGAGFGGEGNRLAGATLGAATGGVSAPAFAALTNPILNAVRKRAPVINNSMSAARRATATEVGDEAVSEANLARRLSQVEQLGMQPLPAQAIDDPVANQIQTGLTRNPSFSNPFFDLVERNQQRANQIVAEAMGLPGNVRKISQTTIGEAFEAASARFERITKSITQPIELDDMFGAKIQSAIDQFEFDGTSQTNIMPRANQLLAWAKKGSISPQQLQRFLSNSSKSMNRNLDGATREAFGEFQNAVLDAAEQSAPEILTELQDARRQWRVLNLIKPAFRNDTGDVSVARLASSLIRQDPNGFTLGRNTSDLYNLARTGDITGLAGSTRLDANSITGTVDSVSQMASPQGIINRLIGDRVSQGFINHPGLFTSFSDPANFTAGSPAGLVAAEQAGAAANPNQ